VTVIPGGDIKEVYTIAPTLRKLTMDKSLKNEFVTRLKDVIVGQHQCVALSIDLPSRSAGTYRLARIDIDASLSKDVEIHYTGDQQLYDKEDDPYPRMMLACSEATTLLSKGVQSGDNDSIREADTMMTVLMQDKDFETVTTRRPIMKKMAATIKQIIKRVSQGPLTESEKKDAIHETTVVYKK
jgi:hypothetical protein